MAINLKSLTPLGSLNAAGRSRARVAEAGAPVPVRPRSETMQRLQIGLSGFAVMVLVIGLASVIKDRVVPDPETIIAETGEHGVLEGEPAPQSDPLADAGLVPDIPAEPEPSAAGGAVPLEPKPTASVPAAQ